MKRNYVILFLIAAMLLFSLSGCSGKKSDASENTKESTTDAADSETDEAKKKISVEEFMKIENGCNSDLSNAIEKYGNICVKTSEKFLDGTTSEHSTYFAGENTVAGTENGDCYAIYDGGLYSAYEDEDGETVFAKVFFFDDYGFGDEVFENYFEFGFDFEYIFEEFGDDDVEIIVNDDKSYTLFSAYPYEDEDGNEIGMVDLTIELNADCELTEIKFVIEEDGSEYSCIEEYITGATDESGLIDKLEAALEEADGEKRNVKLMEVYDGEVVGTIEMDPPAGFMCSASYPLNCCDEYGNVNIYRDIELTDLITETSVDEDLTGYIRIYDLSTNGEDTAE